MEDEEPIRHPRKELALGAKLDGMSVGELRDYARALEAELERVKTAIDGQSAYRSAAEALFKTPKDK